MHAHQVGIESLGGQAPEPGGIPLIGGRHLLAGRLASVICFGLALAVFLVAIPSVYHRLANPPEAVRASLVTHGVSFPPMPST